MKISIITATLDNKAGLIRAIESVQNQTYKNVEHIIIDGGSTDGSVEVIKNLEFRIKNDQNNRPFDSAQGDNLDSPLPTTHYSLLTISEADSGIYDAINKGIKFATGDVIGLLHSDDFYNDKFVLEKYAEVFTQSAKRQAHSDSKNQPPATNNPRPTIDAVYSDLVYVMGKSKVKSQKSKNEHYNHSDLKIDYSIIRYWKAHKLKKVSFTTHYSPPTTTNLKYGWMPPHPTLFIKKEVFDMYGLYRTDMKIAADYEMILRLFYKYKITSHYLPLTTYCMTIGGASNKSLKNIFIKSSEDYRSLKMHNLRFPIFTLLYKNLRKIPQFIKMKY
jgi:glycosyltransferase